MLFYMHFCHPFCEYHDLYDTAKTCFVEIKFFQTCQWYIIYFVIGLFIRPFFITLCSELKIMKYILSLDGKGREVVVVIYYHSHKFLRLFAV